MAAEDDEDMQGGAADVASLENQGRFSAKKVLLFVVLPLLVIGGVGGGLYFSGIIGKKGEATEETASAGEGHGNGQGNGQGKGHGKGKDAGGPSAFFLEIPNMIVNLDAEGDETRYLRLSVQLELKSEADRAAVESVLPRVVDQFQTYLRELRVADLRGSQGVYRLQMELLSRVNTAAYPVEVKDVLFQEILIQ